MHGPEKLRAIQNVYFVWLYFFAVSHNYAVYTSFLLYFVWHFAQRKIDLKMVTKKCYNKYINMPCRKWLKYSIFYNLVNF